VRVRGQIVELLGGSTDAVVSAGVDRVDDGTDSAGLLADGGAAGLSSTEFYIHRPYIAVLPWISLLTNDQGR
jgi:hypothetical protein